ncbi:MAG: hypothetical protein IPI42_06575 [Saprospiraceae bacterium]|nr:hypothetical protein [Candidatus Parvibacillus calidus]
MSISFVGQRTEEPCIEVRRLTKAINSPVMSCRDNADAFFIFALSEVTWSINHTVTC